MLPSEAPKGLSHYLSSFLPNTQPTSSSLSPREYIKPPGGGSRYSLRSRVFLSLAQWAWYPLLDPLPPPTKIQFRPQLHETSLGLSPTSTAPAHQSYPSPAPTQGPQCIMNMHEYECMNMHSPGEPGEPLEGQECDWYFCLTSPSQGMAQRRRLVHVL